MNHSGVSWPAAVAAGLATVIAWIGLAAILTVVWADRAIGGLVALGIFAVIGCVLLLRPGARARGAGVGTIAVLIPCAIGLAITLL